MAREVEERRRREEEARFMAEQQRLREEKEAQERARAEQEENERLQRQVSQTHTGRFGFMFIHPRHPVFASSLILKYSSRRITLSKNRFYLKKSV